MSKEIVTIYDHENTYKGYPFYKDGEKSKVWWVDNSNDSVGSYLFSFDKKKVYNLFRDYPDALTKEEKEIFDSSEPYWRDFFSESKK